ncbi:prepilin-type N-terminal cleavage/methylation domain-containing protein [Verrucomicrobiota bacterium]
MNNSQGFTLIELVIVMIIISILIAVAVPMFIDLTDDAQLAHDRELIAKLRTETVLMMATNALGNATNAYGYYWPETAAEVWAGMSGTGNATSWLHSSSTVTYDPTNGAWAGVQ